MDNLAIARVLAEIADLLEIKSENPFKIRAYRNAAETVIHSASARCAARRKPTCARCRVRQGSRGEDRRTRRYRHHPLSPGPLQEFPPTILDMLHLQGVGPKTVALLYRELGLRTLDDLQAAARDGRLRDLKGMGAKKESQILKALEERAARRRPPADGRGVRRRRLTRRGASRTMRRTPGSASSAACGAAARRAAISTSSPPAAPASLMGAFTGYKLVERILAHGETKSSVLLWGGFQADLRLVPARASAPRCSTSPARSITTSRCATAPSSTASS